MELHVSTTNRATVCFSYLYACTHITHKNSHRAAVHTSCAATGLGLAMATASMQASFYIACLDVFG